MRDCELFESRYIDWKSGRLKLEDGEALAQHQHNCPHCAALSEGDLRLRSLLAQQHAYRPKAGFEMRLDNAIKTVEAGGKPVRNRSVIPFPRMAALGAGLATGLAVGLFVFTSPVNESATQTIAANHAASKIQYAKVSEKDRQMSDDTLLARRDSLTEDVSHYDAGQFSRSVSTK